MARSSRPVGSLAALGAMTAAVLSFSLSTSVVKWAAVTGVVLAFWRMCMSVVTWWSVLIAQRRPLPDRRTWTLVAPAGLFFGMNISLLFTAVTKTSIAHVEFITTLTPLLVVPAGALIFAERPNWSALRFGVISIVGVAIVLFFGSATANASLSGDLIVVIVLFSWTGYLIFTKRARAAGVDTVTFMACMMPLGLITTTPMAILLAGDEIFSMTRRGWITAAFLAILTGMIAHGCIAFAQQHLPIATITVMQTAQPALAVVWAFVILDESVRPLQIVGMVLVIGGIAAFTLASQRGPEIRSAVP